MKVRSKIYKGIEYILLSDLPTEQKEKICTSLNEDAIIKILIDEKVVTNCIQYKDYELWFDNVYRKVVASPSVKIERVPDASNVLVALGKG
jgi:hypothetical protein